MGSLKNVLSQMNKKYGEGTIDKLNDNKVDVKKFSSGSISLDYALGGGYPFGRIVEIFGSESSGKTTLTLHAIKSVQESGGLAAFIDAEHAFDPEYATNIGVNVDDLLFSQPDYGEMALDLVEGLCTVEGMKLIVVDSVAALTPKAEIEGEMGDSKMGLQARLMSQAMRKLAGKASANGVTIIFINQLRKKIGIMFGNPEVTSGGEALKYYSSVRLDVRNVGTNRDNSDQKVAYSSKTRVKVVKNKVAPPHKKSEFNILYGTGIDLVGEVFDMAVDNGIIEKSGSWYSYNGDKLGQGKETAKELLEDEEFFKQIKDSVLNVDTN